MDINFEYYKVFYYVAHLKSFTLAAKALFITQSAVSKSIGKLEEGLNCKLFDRRGKMSLTPEGAALYGHVSQAFGHITSGVARISDMVKLNGGEICIGAVHMLIKYFLLPYLESFHNKYPNIAIRFDNSDMRGNAAALRAGKIDFGIVTVPVDRPEDFEVIPISPIRDIFVAGSRFNELRDRALDLHEISQYPIICLKTGMISREYIDSLFLKNNIILKPLFEMEMMDLMIPFAEIGLGISLVTDNAAKNAIAMGKIFEVKLKNPFPVRQICIIKNKGESLSSAASEFIKELHDLK